MKGIFIVKLPFELEITDAAEYKQSTLLMQPVPHLFGRLECALVEHPALKHS